MICFKPSCWSELEIAFFNVIFTVTGILWTTLGVFFSLLMEAGVVSLSWNLLLSLLFLIDSGICDSFGGLGIFFILSQSSDSLEAKYSSAEKLIKFNE